MIYEFDECVLDTGTQQLRRAGEVVHVEPQVLAVLEHLAANSDRMVPKIELLDEVWGDRFVSESALTSRIKLARKACGDSGREQRIVKTIHGRGYRLVAEVAERSDSSKRSRAKASEATVATDRSAEGIEGREAELARLDGALEAVERGERRTVFVTGEAGAGKSTLVAELLEHDDDPGSHLVLRGQCLQARSGVEPYFCLLEALTQLSHTEPDLVRSSLERVAPLWLTQLPMLVDDDLAERLERRTLGATPQRMLREGASAFEELARDRPVVLVLESLQWADDCALDVIELLAHRTDPLPLLVVGTARDEPGAVLDAISNAVSAGPAEEIRLGPLDRDAVESIVRNRFGDAAVPDRLIDAVNDRCDGVPLFAAEILNSWLREGHLQVADDGVAIVGSPEALEATVPPTVAPLIERELTGLDIGDLALLEAAAVTGVAFDGAAVAAGLDQPLTQVEDALASLSRRVHLISAEGGSSWPDGTRSTGYSFRHGIYRDVVLERIPTGRRLELHERIGTAIEEGYRSRLDEMTVTLAEHFVNTGDAARAIEYLRRSGEQAVARSAHDHAVRFLESALDRVDQLDPGSERDLSELRVRTALGPALVATRGWIDDSVAANYERALALCDPAGPCPEANAARYGMATVTELRGEFERTEALLAPLLEEAVPGGLAMEAHELMACSTFHQGAFTKSAENSDAVLETWDDDAYSVLMARIAEHPASSCNSWLSVASWYLGRSDESVGRAERAVELAEHNLYALSTATSMRAMLHQLRQEPEPCLEWAIRTHEVAGDQDFPMRMIQADMFRGWALGASGSPEDGLSLITDGLSRFRAAGARLNEAYYMAMAAETHLHANRPEEALDLLGEALEKMGHTTRSYFYESDIHRLRARALMMIAGDDAVPEARLALDRSREVADDQRSPALALRTTVDRLRLEIDHGNPDPWRTELVELVAGYDGQAPTPDLEAARELLNT